MISVTSLLTIVDRHTCAKGGGGEVPPSEGSLSPTAIFNIPDQGCNSEKKFSLPYSPISEKNFLPALFSLSKIFFAPCPIPLPENLISSPPFSPLTKNYLANSLPTSPLTSLPTSPISEIKIHISLLYFLFPRPYPPPEFFL